MEIMETNKKTVIAMIALGACARMLPHPWNFTPMAAIGLYAGAKSPRLRMGVFATLAALLVSDLALGFYQGMWYVYAASLISVLLGSLVRRRESVLAVAAGAGAASVAFFLITNFMLWATGSLYPHTLTGLSACFAAAIPFYQSQLAGDAFYTAALFGGHALIRRFTRPVLQTA